jgi:NitT/TauT family transport system substrate-binding protein
MSKTAKIALAIIVIIVAGFLVWWGANSKKQTATTNEPLRIGLNPWIGHGLYYVAKDKGFFDAEKINVQLEDYSDGAVGKQLLATGQVDVLSLTPETAVVLNDAGIKFKAVAMTDTSVGADGIIAAQNIKTIADLRGKKVAYEEGSPSHFFLSYLLDKEGMTTKDLQSVNVIAPDAGAAFVSGKVDAAVTWQPWLSKASDRPGGHLIVTSKDTPILPAMPMVRDDVLAKRPQDIKAMLRALFNAREWILAHPDEAYPIIAKGFNITEQEVKDQIPDFKWFSYEDNLSGFGSGNYSAPQLIQVAGDLWQKLGITKTKVNAADLVDTSLIQKLNK